MNTFKFYFNDKAGSKHYIHSGLYKKPQSTKAYRLLEQRFNEGKIEGFGFEAE